MKALKSPHKYTTESREFKSSLSRTGCYRVLYPGYKHFTYRDYRTVLSAARLSCCTLHRKEMTSANFFSLFRCNDECISTSYCRTFSYRYGTASVSSNAGGGGGDIGNCLLSDRLNLEPVSAFLVRADGMGGKWDVFQVVAIESGRS